MKSIEEKDTLIRSGWNDGKDEVYCSKCGIWYNKNNGHICRKETSKKKEG